MKSVNELFQSCENVNASFNGAMAAMSGLDSNEIQAVICKIITAVCESTDENALEYALCVFETLETTETLKEFGVDISETVGSITDIEEEPIKRCPICGCPVNVKQSDNGKFYVDCDYCPLKSEPIFGSRAEAVDYFNDRM